MSGIAGILKTPSIAVSEEELNRLANAIAHRGPDGRARFMDVNIGLAHCFLQIPSAQI